MEGVEVAAKVIDRAAQKKCWREIFFDSHVMKFLGLAAICDLALLIVFVLCIFLGDGPNSDRVWELFSQITLLIIGAIISAAGVKTENALRC